MLKKVAKRTKKRVGWKVPGRLSLGSVAYKDPCYGPLTERSKTQAAEADRMGNLDLLDGKLQCAGCGKMVGAKKAAIGDHYLTDPRPHERYKEPRQPARKRDQSKRIRP